MDDFRLKVFISAAKHLSFTKASEEMFITQPAVTKHIRELEAKYTTRLFDRNGNKLTLTASGQYLLQYSEKIIDLYRRLDYDMNLLSNQYKGDLNIGASTTIAQYVLPSMLARFHERFNDVSLTMINGNSYEIESELQKNNIDLGLVEGQNRIAGLKYTTFMDDELVAIASTKRKLVKYDEMSIDQLKQTPLVLRENGSGTLDVIKSELAKYGYKLSDMQVQMQLGSTESIKRYLENADALGIVSIRSVDREIVAGNFKVIELPEIKMIRQFAFVQRLGQESPLVELFINFTKI